MREQYLSFIGERVYRQPGQLVRLRAAGARSDLRAHAGNARARVPGDADRGLARHSARALCRAEARTAQVAKAIMAGSILGFSLPTFWVGLILIMVFAVQLGWLPSTGRGPTTDVLGLQLSIFNLEGLEVCAAAGDQPRAVQAVADHPAHARAGARAKCCSTTSSSRARRGSPNRRVIGVHLLKNIMIPLDHRDRARARIGDRVRGRHRNDFRVARHGQAGDRFDLPARPAGGGRVPAGRSCSCSS